MTSHVTHSYICNLYYAHAVIKEFNPVYTQITFKVQRPDWKNLGEDDLLWFFFPSFCPQFGHLPIPTYYSAFPYHTTATNKG